ncbi:MAG: hypothetical protein O9284_09030 [Steroidobacteraceae bacterium]|jgi:predicted ferric reductase|nr:hypothetical protein [Steroidobacteraceae bacterium]
MALGYAALALLGLQFLLTARFKLIALPFGIDLVYYVHRYLAIGGLALVTAHAALVAVRQPALAGLGAWPEPHVVAGIGAWALWSGLVLAALLRRQTRQHYDAWRRLHAAAAVLAYGAALWHVWASGRYLESTVDRALFAVSAGGWLALLAWVRAVRPAWVARRPWRVDSVHAETERVWSIAVVPVGHGGLRFQPGQFAWVTVRRSPWSMREHPFSIASSAERPARLEFTVKERGDFTRSVRRLAVGERVWIDAPYGCFSVDRHPAAPRFVFIAGGVGIAPILSMLRTLADRRDPRPLLLIYANDALAGAAHLAELLALSDRLDLRVVPVIKDPPPDWTGERGYVTRDLLERCLPRETRAAEYFLCGPPPMTEAVESALGELGVSPWRIRTELFDLV